MRDGVHLDPEKEHDNGTKQENIEIFSGIAENMTKEERHLWYDFLKFYPLPFHRQYSIGEYIVDFYCHKAKLVLELDGSQHCEPNQIEYDRKRTAFLEGRGLYVMRISNLDVIQQFRAVCEMIDAVVHQRISQ